MKTERVQNNPPMGLLTFKFYMVQEFPKDLFVSNFVKAHCSFVGKGIMAINNTSSISISNAYKYII
jgi:hypothetical protein